MRSFAGISRFKFRREFSAFEKFQELESFNLNPSRIVNWKRTVASAFTMFATSQEGLRIKTSDYYRRYFLPIRLFFREVTFVEKENGEKTDVREMWMR